MHGINYDLAKKGSGSVDDGVQQMQSLFYKKVLYTLEERTIIEFRNNIPIYADEDIGILELEGYQYDRQKSVTSGQNCYVKASDHCLTGDTLIKTTKGYIPIKELVGTNGQLYAYNGKDIVVKNYDNCRMTQSNVDIYELELENGLKIKGTYDHPILTTKGYKMLGDLKETDKVLYSL